MISTGLPYTQCASLGVANLAVLDLAHALSVLHDECNYLVAGVTASDGLLVRVRADTEVALEPGDVTLPG
jgi:hypothetical protein